MTLFAARKQEPVKVLRDASTAELDELFREVTVAAAKEAMAAGLMVVGTDCHGRIVKSPAAELPEDGAASSAAEREADLLAD